MENACQADLFADHTSAATMRANTALRISEISV
jgi:hypothetical protein